ncbi:MAG: hypothetical protein HYV27_16620 [Candidatus Hydrogenedentes bacterium]|nr:hypothetical protein [Candidatus Hydrogenedentota bacterium]
MEVYEYSATVHDSESIVEEGTVIARDKLDAFDKMKRQNYTNIALRRLSGWQAFISRWTPDIQ